MSNVYFRFKQFTVDQSQAAMKVNTDGVLLGAWTPLPEAGRILDVGTGTGLIALMLAQRNPQSFIDAVEIDRASAQQASANVHNSPWAHITVHAVSFQQFAVETAHRYALIVSNPPYFVNALQSDSEKRTLSRHALTLSGNDLLTGVNALLLPDGHFSVILPYVEGNVFIAQAAAKQLYCTHKVKVYSCAGKPVKRLLLLFAKQAGRLRESSLTIHRSCSSDYTPEYKALTKDYYLYF